VVPAGAARSRVSSVLDAERLHPLLAEPLGRGRGGVAGEEVQRDRRLHIGEDGLRAGPVRIQQRGELVGRGDPHLDQVLAGTDHGAQRLGLGRVRRDDAQPMRAQPQVLRDHLGVASVVLGTGEHLAVPPRLDRLRLDRDDRVAGLQQRVNQPPVRALDPDRDAVGVTQPGQPASQVGEPGGGVLDGEPDSDPSGGVQHAHRMRLGGPVHPDVVGGMVGQGKRHRNSSRRQRRPGVEAACRAVTNWRSAARSSVAGPQPRQNRGRQCHRGPQRATITGRHPGSRRVPSGTPKGALTRMVP
jgi:hypothetical protein